MSAILSFLGGSAFRMVWGELSSYFKSRQEHKIELDRMKLQGELDAAQHARRLEAVKLEADLGVKTIEVQSAADADMAAADAFREAMAASRAPTGIAWVDAWNATVRPSYATVALFLWVLSIHQAGWVLTAWSLELMGSVAGYFFADRTLGKRGK